MNTPVKFELAKLLKDKGFDMLTKKYYEHALTSQIDEETNDYVGTFGWKKGETNIQSYNFINNHPNVDLSNENWYMCSAPTIAEVVMWLYEKHEIWIISSYELAEDNITKEWFWIAIKDGEEVAFNYGGYTSPTEAYEAAITYCLNNLL